MTTGIPWRFSRSRLGALLARLGSAARVAALSCAVAGALPSSAPPARAQWVVQLTEENDEFCDCGDDHYTQGLRLTVEPRASSVSRVPVWRFTLGQIMYTPRDLLAETPILDDRPYAGWLFAGAGRVSQNDRRETLIEVLAGPTGKWSYSREVQIAVHRLFHATVPRGWDNQLAPKLGLYLRGTADQMIAAVRLTRRLAIDGTASGSIEAGTAFFRVGGGGQVRVGILQSAPWGGPRPPSITYGERRGAGGWAARFEPLEIYGYARVLGNRVLGNFSLDGDAPNGGAWVEKKPWVGEIEGGITLGVGVASLRYGIVYRSAEFEGGPAQGFGTIWIALGGRARR